MKLEPRGKSKQIVSVLLQGLDMSKMVQVKVALKGDKTEEGGLHVLCKGIYSESHFDMIEICGEEGLGNVVFLQWKDGAEFIALMPEEVEFI